MTGKTSTVRRKRRPQRSNTLKDIGRLLGVAGTTHIDRKDKLLAHAAFLNDTALPQLHRVAWQIIDHARAIKLREEAKWKRRA